MSGHGLGRIIDQAKFEESLEQAQADGRMSLADAEEVRTFADFLDEAGPAPGNEGYNRERFLAAYAKHYPEEYRKMMDRVEKQDRR